MKTNRKVTSVSTLIFLILFLVLAAVIGKPVRNKVETESMIKTTLEWGRLAPIPGSKSDFRISTEGGPFTRAFRSSFRLPKADLDKWIQASPGFSDAEKVEGNGSGDKYVIKPGGGAQYAEVTIDRGNGFVEIYVYWS